MVSNIAAYITDMQNNKATKKAKKQLQEDLDRSNAERFRDDAMLTMRQSR